MRLRDFDLLDEIGLTSYEKSALLTLMRLGVADAASLCREGAIPTSKIYQAMEKLGRMGLAAIQRTRPKIYAARPPQAVASEVGRLVREHADAVIAQTEALGEALAALPETVAAAAKRSSIWRSARKAMRGVISRFLQRPRRASSLISSSATSRCWKARPRVASTC